MNSQAVPIIQIRSLPQTYDNTILFDLYSIMVFFHFRGIAFCSLEPCHKLLSRRRLFIHKPFQIFDAIHMYLSIRTINYERFWLPIPQIIGLFVMPPAEVELRSYHACFRIYG